MRATGYKRAFTLLEMLVALAMMAVLAGSLYASLHLGFQSQRRAEAAVAPVRTAMLTLDALRRDISMALPPTGILAGPFDGQAGVMDRSGQPAGWLEFFSASDEYEQDGLWAGIRKIEIAVAVPDGDPDADGVLVRRITANLLAPETPEPVEEVICRHVVWLTLRYFDGAEWLDSWDSTLRDNTLPLAVEAAIGIRNTYARGDDPEIFEARRMFPLPGARLDLDEPPSLFNFDR